MTGQRDSSTSRIRWSLTEEALPSWDGHDVEPLRAYLDRRGEWLTHCAFVLTEGHDAAQRLLQDTMAAAWRYYDWVSATEDPELYLLRILANEFHEPRRVAAVLRRWANFDDRRVADVLGCRKATVRRLAADGLCPSLGILAQPTCSPYGFRLP